MEFLLNFLRFICSAPTNHNTNDNDNVSSNTEPFIIICNIEIRSSNNNSASTCNGECTEIIGERGTASNAAFQAAANQSGFLAVAGTHT